LIDKRKFKNLELELDDESEKPEENNKVDISNYQKEKM